VHPPAQSSPAASCSWHAAYTAATSRNKSLESSSVSQAPPLFDASCFLRRLHRSNKAEVLMWVSYRATEKRNVCDAVLPDTLAIDTVTL
jgi:hypothetical protein